jgi:hypothetical protein
VIDMATAFNRKPPPSRPVSRPASRAADPKLAAVAGPAGLKVNQAGLTNDLQPKIVRLIDTYGVSGLASLLDVSKSQPSRWRAGKDRPSFESTRRIIDLDYVTSRLAEELTAYQLQEWFAGPNPHLAWSTPAVVFTHFGIHRLEPAIQAIEVGASA